MFDADAYLEPIGRPEIRIGGRLYRGRFVSPDQLAPMEADLVAMARGELPARRRSTLIYKLFFLAYGKDWLRPWRPSVAALVLRLPMRAQVEALSDFLDHLRLANGGAAQTTETPGTS